MRKNELITLTNQRGKSDNFYFFVSLFNGLILMLFGRKIEFFLFHMSFLQRLGLSFVLGTMAIFTLSRKGSKKKSKTSKTIDGIQKFIIFISFFISFLYVLLDKIDFLIYQIQTLSGPIYIFITLLSANLLAFLIKKIKEVDKKIEDPTERITILVGFFGIVISLLNLL